MTLSAGQTAVLEYIKDHQCKHGYPPTMREIGLGVGYASPSTVHGMLSRLKNKGYVDWIEGSPRTLKVLQ